ncbi:hypothetical protein ACFWY9_30555 [Amycolatopsis sp. NPDC059027]|uniref:hypothetical protein n=1 Tax=Amycolatopsis sp. NPDC059027 TaxID=3346709 RepID=UPI003672DFF7
MSSGGRPFEGRFRATNKSVTPGGYENNTLFYKTRGPFFVVGNSFPIPDTIRESELEPIRPSMRMATGSHRVWVGTSRSRWNGDHTWLRDQVVDAKQIGTQKGGMRAARLNRLTVQEYRGQSYSQTTRVLGARGA